MFKSFKFCASQTIDMERFARTLCELGYRRQAKVAEEGDFASRGGLIDVFPSTFEYPVRIEWDDERIRDIRSFSLRTGKPFWDHSIVILLPCRGRTPPSRTVTGEEFPLSNFVDIKKGDFVVHQLHGIGIFRGLERTGSPDRSHEHIVIQYARGDRLLVPIEQLHLLQKYIRLGSSGGGRVPKIHRLGSGEWKRTKARARKAVMKVAMDLLNVQAMRKALDGFVFAPDTSWQAAFEKTFPYSETPDQKKALLETKRDMESACVMDRLLCGDVGYGKTEVAMRSAFKCVMSHKQVAFLVPTTILAEQHYQNFSRRLSDFPVRVEMLSRFKTASEQKGILRDVASGRVDILIGTHRLVSSDIVFDNLGLVIIDEEQRFGVKTKEKLKQLRLMVDVLMLTATPIPRTLYMSLMGAKDISVINTPPENRMAVETHTVVYNKILLRQAIKRELTRRGQVYFVHNRVADIEQVKEEVVRLSPTKAKVAFAHGQMPPKVLEKIMVDFLAGRVDVLVSTSIIESGIDVPNANTLIVNNAQEFGLADLHQLRGRVGRFRRQAYAYFLVRDGRLLTPEASRRLEAIQLFSELGSGFRIAMQDLQIRGGGNILGVQQHGHITAVGFDLYCRLLRQAIGALKGSVLN